MTTTELLVHYYAQADQQTWQHELRQRVRLLLALTEPGLDSHTVHAALCLVEDALRSQLLASAPAHADAPDALATAALVVHRYQVALLGQRTEHDALRRELPVAEFARALRPTCHPPAIGWLLTA